MWENANDQCLHFHSLPKNAEPTWRQFFHLAPISVCRPCYNICFKPLHSYLPISQETWYRSFVTSVGWSTLLRTLAQYIAHALIVFFSKIHLQAITQNYHSGFYVRCIWSCTEVVYSYSFEIWHSIEPEYCVVTDSRKQPWSVFRIPWYRVKILDAAAIWQCTTHSSIVISAFRQ